MLLRIVSVTALILVLIGCAGRSTTIDRPKGMPIVIQDHQTLTVQSSDQSTTMPMMGANNIPTIQEINAQWGTKWGARYSYLFASNYRGLQIYQMRPGEGHPVRVMPSNADGDRFSFTAVQNPDIVFVTYIDEETGNRVPLCSMKGVTAWVNNEPAGFGSEDGPNCRLRMFFWLPR